MTDTATLPRTGTDNFDAIAGVDLGTYAGIVAAQLWADPVDLAIDPQLVEAAIPYKNWSHARAGWSRRIREDAAVREEYTRLYRAAIKGAGY